MLISICSETPAYTTRDTEGTGHAASVRIYVDTLALTLSHKRLIRI